MIVYRAAKNIFSNKLTGEGARVAGGRWNSKGISIIYTAESRLLCMLELAVHVGMINIPDNYKLITIEINDKVKIKKIDVASLPKNWAKNPPPAETQIIGDKFVKENNALILKVPSAINKESFNYLINSAHPEFNKLQIIKKEVLKVDERLIN
ncbi:RES domain protein [bacterium BMS3Abin03]|nr:RES domain protein [bacterium BMS3Abin03]